MSGDLGRRPVRTVTGTVRLTAAEALVRWMVAQRAELLDGTEVPLFAGIFAIFGHGNVLGLGTALYECREDLPTWRGHTEQGMALAAVAHAKATSRRQLMAVTSSVGPGALNMVTAAGVAHANRLPVLLLPGDTFAGRAPDPVLQQVENFGDLGATVNDAFRPVSRLFDRIMRPEQLLATLPQVARVLTDPADAGPVVLALPQDIQVEEFDFPVSLFTPHLNRVPRPRPDTGQMSAAVAVLRSARRPLLVAGGGVRYSGAGAELLAVAEAYGIPFVETTAGRTVLPEPHPRNAGPLGITGSSSANALAGQADVVVAVGTRLQDFTTASWTVFAADAQIVQINVAGFDAVKHGAVAVVGDARESLTELAAGLRGWQAPADWSASAESQRQSWDAAISTLRGPQSHGDLTYAQVVGVVNDASGPDDYVMTAAGGLPGELVGGWRTHGNIGRGPTMDVEYGFSCMGYELAGAWGAAIARGRTHPGGVVTTLLGDGSYLMLNSELFSAAFAGHPFVAVVCDNDGYGVIERLQTGQGAASFNNMYADVAGPGGVRVDFAAHAAALGCVVEDVPAGSAIEALRSAYGRARDLALSGQQPVVLVVRTHPDSWTESGAWWEVGVPGALAAGRDAFEAGKARQLRYLG